MKTRKIEEIRADMNPSSCSVTLRIDGREFSGRVQREDTVQDAYGKLLEEIREEYPDWMYADIGFVTRPIWTLLCALHEAQRA